MKRRHLLTLAMATLTTASAHAQSVIQDLPNDPQGPLAKVNGDLMVANGAFLSFDPISLTPTWSGIPAQQQWDSIDYYGPLEVGNRTQVHHYLASKAGTRGTTSILPLGKMLNITGPTEIYVVMEGTGGANSGSAYYLLIGSARQLQVVKHTAIGAATRLKLHAINGRLESMLSLEFDGHQDPDPSRTTTTTMSVRVVSQNTLAPESREFSFGWAHSSNARELTTLLEASDSFQQGVIGNSWQRPLGNSTKTISADTVQLDGKVILTEPQGDISMGIFAPNP